FWLTYSAKEGKINAYHGAGRSGSNVTRDRYTGEKTIPVRGIRSAITVPGMVDGWDAVLKKYGTFTLKDVLQPAIHYALNGFPFSKDLHFNTQEQKKLWTKCPHFA